MNEDKNLPHVLPKIPAWVDEVLLVDGHSSDNTMSVAKNILPGIKVLCQPGKGKGNAIKYGVQNAKGEIVITLDADGSTDPEDLPRFIQPLIDGYDFTKGSRLTNGRPKNMPQYRWIGNKILSITFNILYGARYTDICSGYNAFWKTAFSRLKLHDDGFEMEQIMLAQARKVHLKIIEVAHYDAGRIGNESKVSGLKQGFIDWLVIIKERFNG